MTTPLPYSTTIVAARIATKSVALSIAFLTIAITATGHLQAQQVYKSIDKQGRVTYSQIPPKPGSEDKLTGNSATNPSLPFTLQQVTNRYPVTLYTIPDSPYCVNARLYLMQRGIPFTEKTVNTSEDKAEFKQRSFENIFPTLTIGNQQLKGFNDIEWSSYLNAAGYPAKSALPNNYTNPAPTPLVAAKKAAEKPNAAATPAAPKPTAEPVRAPDPSNPTGIKF
ncbi:MAG TPA: glutaredoxin family protein [Burkholderiaceae bacterium]|nr:glutaredoxin family protein [Burkholderiaceae bacterium]